MHSPQPLSTSAMTSQSHSNPRRHNSNTKNVLRAHVNGTEIILKSTDRRSNFSRFLYVQWLIHGYLIMFILRVIRLNCFSKMWRISLPRILQNNDFQSWIRTAGVITNDGFPECIILYNALCTMHAGETMHCKPCYKIYHTIQYGSGKCDICQYLSEDFADAMSRSVAICNIYHYLMLAPQSQFWMNINHDKAHIPHILTLWRK